MNKNFLESEILAFVENKFPDALKEFDVSVKDQSTANINSVHIQNLVHAIYYTFLQLRPDSCTMLYILVRQFAFAFNDTDKIEFLSKIWSGREKGGVPVPNLETIVIRDLSNPYFRIGKKYNYGFGQTYTLSELNRLMQIAKRKIMDVFNQIYLENDLQVEFTLPNFTVESQGGMPKL